MVGEGAWIAIVDDDPSVLKALSRSLRLRGLTARAYRSAQAFLAELSEGQPCCLVLDLQMPGMTGLELLQNLKQQRIRIPTVVVTAHGDDAVRERCALAGATAFLSKPPQNATLFAAIDAAIGAVRGTAEPPGGR